MKIRIISIIMTIFLICSFAIGINADAEKINVFVDGQKINFDQEPIIENGRTLVPVRVIFEALDANVDWNDKTKTVVGTKNDVKITLKINSRMMTKNNEVIVLEVAPKILNSRTIVPLRAISESFDAVVLWEEKTKSVKITTKIQQAPKPEIPNETGFEKRVLELVNIERSKNGLNPLLWDENLANVARAHSKDMHDRGFMAHNNPDGLSPFDRMKNAGISYKSAAENIAAGYDTPEAVVEGWMNSEGHRKNILNPGLKELGVGFYQGSKGYRTYWTQCFKG